MDRYRTSQRYTATEDESLEAGEGLKALGRAFMAVGKPLLRLSAKQLKKLNELRKKKEKSKHDKDLLEEYEDL